MKKPQAGDRVRVTSRGSYCEGYTGTVLGRIGTLQPVRYCVKFDEPNTDLYHGSEPNEYEAFLGGELEPLEVNDQFIPQMRERTLNSGP